LLREVSVSSLFCFQETSTPECKYLNISRTNQVCVQNITEHLKHTL
jgi:hypothetical protein